MENRFKCRAARHLRYLLLGADREEANRTLAAAYQVGLRSSIDLAGPDLEPSQQEDLELEVHVGERAIEELLRRNLPLIRATVRRHAPASWPFDDVMQEARLAVLRGAADYDPSGPASVATWLVWKIRGVCSPANRYRHEIGKGRVQVGSFERPGTSDGRWDALDPSTGESAEDVALEPGLLDRLQALSDELPAAHAEAVGAVSDYVRHHANLTGQRWRSEAGRCLIAHPSAGIIDEVASEIGVAPLGWRANAACKGLPTAQYFPQRGEVVADEVLGLCASCPVNGICARVAAQVPYPRGLWGGQSARERRDMASTSLELAQSAEQQLRPHAAPG